MWFCSCRGRAKNHGSLQGVYLVGSLMKLLKTVISLFAIILFVPLTIQAQALPAQSHQGNQGKVSDFEKFKTAIDAGDVEEVKKLLANEEIKPNATDARERTGLIYAIERHSHEFTKKSINLEIIRAFVNDPRVDKNAQDELKEAALHKAARLKVDALEVLNLFFQNEEVKFDIRNRWLEAPLHVAAVSAKDPRVIEAFFAVLSDLNPRDHLGRTPLLKMLDQFSLNLENVEIFLNERRVDLKARDNEYRGVRQYIQEGGAAQKLVDNAFRKRGLKARLLKLPKSVRERVLRRNGKQKSKGLQPATGCY